jgi:hypothetical protein
VVDVGVSRTREILCKPPLGSNVVVPRSLQDWHYPSQLALLEKIAGEVQSSSVYDWMSSLNVAYTCPLLVGSILENRRKCWQTIDKRSLKS